MQDNANSELPTLKRTPWNKGKLIGAKPPLRQKHVWAIRTKLQIEKRMRELAMFNLAIDSKLRGCDVVALKVEDVAPNGYSVDRATVRQKKTGRAVRFELTEQTRQAVDDYIRTVGKKPGEFLFTALRGPEHGMSTRQYARLRLYGVAGEFRVAAEERVDQDDRRVELDAKSRMAEPNQVHWGPHPKRAQSGRRRAYPHAPNYTRNKYRQRYVLKGA